MSRYGGDAYPRERRDRSPPRFQQDRRDTFDGPPRAPRGGMRALRDAPPLRGSSYRDPRDFPRDDPPRPRRNSRDGPLSAGPAYDSPPSFRGGFGRERGRGRGDFRGGRRFVDDRDLQRDRSPPRGWQDRSPERRDDRRFDRDNRWPERNDRDRDLDRRRDIPPRLDTRNSVDSQGSGSYSAGAHVNPERLALIDDGASPDASRRSSTTLPHSLSAGARDGRSDFQPYFPRADPPANRFAARAASPPTQPPPVPEFSMSLAPPEQSSTPSTKPAENASTEAPSSSAPAATSVQVSASEPPSAPQTRPVEASQTRPDPPPAAPRAPRAESESNLAPTHRLQNARSWESTSSEAAQSRPDSMVSPSMSHALRPSDLGAPTGPKADRNLAQASPRMSTNASLPASGPPATAPSGPRRNTSMSPRMTFAAPTAPRADRGPVKVGEQTSIQQRAPERSLSNSRPPPAAPRAPSWNQWRRPAASANEKLVPAKRDSSGEEKKPSISESATSDDLVSNARLSSRMDVDAPVEPPTKASSFTGHSAQQSFFGKPDSDIDDDKEASDAADEKMSTTDEDDFEAEDQALFEAKFERTKRELEKQRIDLSSREYRATTPLESIARLSRLTMQDVQRFKEREPAMEIDEPVIEPAIPPVTHSSESDEGADLLTPRGEDNTSVEIRDGDDAEEQEIRRIRRPTPDAISLPYLSKSRLHTSDVAIKDTSMTFDDSAIDLEMIVSQDLQEEKDDARNLQAHFAHLYRQWQEVCEDLDFDREEQEKLERQASIEPTEPESALPTAEATTARNRLTKFNSEFDLARVLEESAKAARLEQEKASLEARRLQADMDKEAIIPDQQIEKDFGRIAFVDNNRLREPETLTMVFAYEPPADDFTEQEQQIFIAAFRETPKKWSEIASLLPSREPKDCIRHYYANKWDGRFRDTRARKKGTGRKARKAPRGKGAAAMADLSRNDVGQDVPILESGRPKRAAAPTTFGEREPEAKATMLGQSPAKRSVPGKDGQSEEKPNKRKKAAGDKPVRKTKATQPLAQIAAAPHLSPDGRVIQQQQQQQAKSIERSRQLEEAALLTGLSGRPAVQHEHPQQMYANADAFMANRAIEEQRMTTSSSGAKPIASSYWSVSEQQDVAKFLAYFGTDFAAIAEHMGTKTPVMIKNHYHRSLANRPELQEAAMAANARRERGEDQGPPPQPQPVTKRKYDAPGPMAQRPTHDQMDIDNMHGAQSMKHGSPPQHHVQSRFAMPATDRMVLDGTPLLATREPAKPYQVAQSSHLGMFGDARQEHRPSITAGAGFRTSQLGTPTTQAAQPSRIPDAPDPLYIQRLRAQQRQAMQAMQVQGQGHDQERRDVYAQHPPLHSPPATQSQMLGGKLPDQRSNTPPVQQYYNKPPPITTVRRPGDPALPFDRYGPGPAMPSPPKREDSRASTYTQPAPAEPAVKRSNVLSLLNSEEEPKPPKRTSLEGNAVPRTSSPAQLTHAYGVPVPPRTESYSAQQYPRTTTAHIPASAPLKQEIHSAGGVSHLPPKDWQGQRTPPLNPPTAYERERPYYSHRSSMLGQMGAPSRAGPSPPPNPLLQHSRTSSLSTDPAHAHPDHRYMSAQHAPPSTIAGYGQPQYAPAPPSTQAPHHQHTAAYPPAPSRQASREEHYRPEPSYREDRDREWRARQEQEEAERRHIESQPHQSHQYAARQGQEQDRYYSRAAPPPQAMHPPYTASHEQPASVMHGGMLGLREQALRDAKQAMSQEEMRQRHSAAYRDRDQAQAEEARLRRHDDAFLPPGGARRTPLGGGFGAPNLPNRR